MARLLELGTLVERCQQRSDREGDGHISPEEWKSLVSEQYGDFWTAVSGTGYRHFETTSTITATGALKYTLPSDHLATVGIARILATSGSPPLPSRFGLYLREAMAQEEWSLAGVLGEARRFAQVGDNVWLYPVPPTGQTYQLRYVPQSPDLTTYDDNNTVDLVTPDGEAFLLWGVAVKARAKSDEDPQLAIVERNEARARVVEWAQLRALHQPRLKYCATDDDACLLDDADWRITR